MEEVKQQIEFEHFKNIDLRIGTVREAEAVADSTKLLKLKVDFGHESRQVLAGIRKSYEPESLIGKSVLFVLNLKPRQIAGFESQAMILVAHGDDGNFKLLQPDGASMPGSVVT